MCKKINTDTHKHTQIHVWRRFTAGDSVAFHLPHSETKTGRDERGRDEKSCRVGLKSHLRGILPHSWSVWENILLFMWPHPLHMLLAAGLLRTSIKQARRTETVHASKNSTLSPRVFTQEEEECIN